LAGAVSSWQQDIRVTDTSSYPKSDGDLDLIHRIQAPSAIVRALTAQSRKWDGHNGLKAQQERANKSLNEIARLEWRAEMLEVIAALRSHALMDSR
jgi:hypothetical protein